MSALIVTAHPDPDSLTHDVARRLADALGADRTTLAHLAQEGFDPVFGARPLKRAVQRYVQDPLAEKILAGEVPDGSTVKVEEGDGALDIAVS